MTAGEIEPSDQSPPRWLVSRLSLLDVDDPLEALTVRIPALGDRTLVEASQDPKMTKMIIRVLSRWEETYGLRS